MEVLMKKIISFIFVVVSLNILAQPLDPFKDKREVFVKLSEHNTKTWAKALECANASTNNDQLMNCEQQLKTDRQSFYQQKKEARPISSKKN